MNPLNNKTASAVRGAAASNKNNLRSNFTLLAVQIKAAFIRLAAWLSVVGGAI
jgi:hypothetical protein